MDSSAVRLLIVDDDDDDIYLINDALNEVGESRYVVTAVNSALAAMAKLAHLAGSLVAVLAIVEQAGDAQNLWQATCLEELWQEQNWGEDYWAQKNRADREAEFLAAAHFLKLLHV